jgi:hypothetical protein
MQEHYMVQILRLVRYVYSLNVLCACSVYALHFLDAHSMVGIA